MSDRVDAEERRERALERRRSMPRLQDRLATNGFLHNGDDLAAVLSAVDHLLSDHDCDLIGYEEVMGARDRLREAAPAIDRIAVFRAFVDGYANGRAASMDARDAADEARRLASAYVDKVTRL